MGRTGFVTSELYVPEQKAAFSDYISAGKPDGLRDILGVFCGAVERDGKWILFRDHMGVKQLYYYLKDDVFAFAEDIRELCAMEGADLSVNETWLYLECRGANSLSLTETEFRYIHCARPGAWMEFTPTADRWEVREHVYWEPGQKKIRMESDADYIAELRRLIEDAVRIRLNSIEGKVGAEASGGLDSSVIDLLIMRSGREAEFVSWSDSYEAVPRQPLDERQVVEDVMGGHPFHFLPEATAETNDALARMLPPCINTLQISQTSKLLHDLGVDNVFSGHGGDEGVSHRANPMELWHFGEYGDYLREVWYLNRGKRLRILRVVKQIAVGVLKTLPERKRGWQNEAMDLGPVMNPEFCAKMKKTTPFPALYFSFDPKKYILQGGSRNRMENCAIQAKDFGVRYLFPFLDHRVVDFAVSIPRRMHHHNGQTRYIYREAFRDLMPQSLYEVNYKDFPSLRTFKPEAAPSQPEPDPEKLRQAMEQWAEGILSMLDWNRWSRYFDRDACKQLLTRDVRTLDSSERSRVFTLRNTIFTCALVQNLQDNAGKWVAR